MNAEIGTPRGWRFDSDTVSAHTHPMTLEGYRLPFTATFMTVGAVVVLLLVARVVRP
ncbi:hypothetical protein PV682_17035 [Streptomyces niveiscabiei]|uniref:hypothetical protein n=1 Tax=Streptomyces niveiscabiei TaxID=164115 RepID=UPI0029A5F2DE|nr:hypothetical protein [Streptomyces niveiscabiei]MDX3383162.1 hypothetical protein [Streptomyces niveiscabiei]